MQIDVLTIFTVLNMWYQNIVLQNPQRRTLLIASTCDI